jgi:hypothetical protein
MSCFENKNQKIGSCYLKKNNSIFYLSRNTEGGIDTLELKGANSEFFEVIFDEIPGNDCYNGNIWAKDKSNVWLKNKVLKGINPRKFKVLENGYSKDENYVYYYDKPLNDAEPAEFKVLGWFFAKTKSNIWFNGKPVYGVDNVNSFQVIDNYFSKDNHTVYFNRDTVLEKIPESNPLSFKCIDNDKAYRLQALKWYADKNKIYVIDTEKIPDSEDFLMIIQTSPDSFQILPQKYYSRDSAFVYYKNTVIQNANVNSFITLGNDYSVDSKFVFYKNKPLKGVEINSFKVNNASKDYDASDSKSKFLKGIKIK